MPRPHALLMGGVLLLFYGDGFVLGAALPLALAFGLLGVAAAAGFLRQAGHGDAGPIDPVPVALAALAALTVLALGRSGLTSVVVAAALVGTIGGLLERLGRPRQRWQGMEAPAYCGAFAGMTSELVLGHPGWVLLAAVLAGLLLTLLHRSWQGIGGKLGTTAFVGVLAACGLARAIGMMGSGAHLHLFSEAERSLVLITALLAPLITHGLSYRWGWGAVLGSAVPSMLMGLLLPLPLAAAWMGASFVGMTTPERLEPHAPPHLAAMGLVFGVLTLGFEPWLAGIGGDLGATAAVSVFAVLGLRELASVRPRRDGGRGT